MNKRARHLLSSTESQVLNSLRLILDSLSLLDGNQEERSSLFNPDMIRKRFNSFCLTKAHDSGLLKFDQIFPSLCAQSKGSQYLEALMLILSALLNYYKQLHPFLFLSQDQKQILDSLIGSETGDEIERVYQINRTLHSLLRVLKPTKPASLLLHSAVTIEG